MIKKAVNLPLSHIWKIGKQSTAQTGNHSSLLLTIFLLWLLFSCLCLLKQKPTSVQTPCSNGTWRKLCIPLKVLCGWLWSGTSVPEKSAVQLEWRVPPALREGKLFLELPTSAHRERAFSCCPADIDDHLEAGYWWMTKYLLYFGVLSGKNHGPFSSSHSCKFLVLCHLWS